MSPRAGLDLNMILMKAAEMADSEGLESVTMASLAQKLGVRSPSLYNHVNGWPALRAQLAVFGLTKLNEAIEQAAGDQKGAGAVVLIADAYLAFAKKHPGLYTLTLQSPPADNAEHIWLGSRLVDRLLYVFSPFGLPEEEGIHAIRGLRSLLHGFASIESQGGFGMPIGLNDSLRYVLQRFLKGLSEPI